MQVVDRFVLGRGDFVCYIEGVCLDLNIDFMYDDQDSGYVQDRIVNYGYSQDFNACDDEHGDDNFVGIFLGLDINLDYYDNVGYAEDGKFDYD